MGCDIHTVFEYKGRWDYLNQWDSFGGELSLTRDYDMFGVLAGVRRGGAVIDPRGYPVDMDYQAKEMRDKWSSDGHTPSYLSGTEYLSACVEYEARCGKEPPLPYRLLEALINECDKDNCDCRLIFVFDN